LNNEFARRASSGLELPNPLGSFQIVENGRQYVNQSGCNIGSMNKKRQTPFDDCLSVAPISAQVAFVILCPDNLCYADGSMLIAGAASPSRNNCTCLHHCLHARHLKAFSGANVHGTKATSQILPHLHEQRISGIAMA